MAFIPLIRNFNIMLTKVALLKMESGFISQRLAGITTVTFFRGDLDVVASNIKERFRKVVNLNPWLTGRLVKNKGDKVINLSYDKPFVSEDLLKRIISNTHADITLNINMKYAEILKAVLPVFVTSANLMLNKPDLVTKLTLVKDSENPNERFSLIFSLSHNVGDGHTYYRLLNMITANSEITALNVTRKYEADHELIDAVGKKEFAYFHGAAHIINALKNTILSRKTNVFAYHVDSEMVTKIRKKTHANRKTNLLSANDIITSSFSNLTGARITSMAINFRNKISRFIDTDAGNYEGVLLLDFPKYQHPEGIRKTLSDGAPYIGLAGKLPSFFSGIFCQMALITNWASFSKEATIENCEELLHLPLILGMPYEAAIIFRARQQKQGIIFFTQKIPATQFESSSLPLGKTISDEIFNS